MPRPSARRQPRQDLTLLPFYWGFDIGLNMSTDDMYKMLTIIEKHSDELAKLDPSFPQIGGGQMAEFQKKALESTWDLVPIHPGLAKYPEGEGHVGREVGFQSRQHDVRA